MPKGSAAVSNKAFATSFKTHKKKPVQPSKSVQEPNTVQPRKSVQEPNTVQPRKSVQEPNTVQPRKSVQEPNTVQPRKSVQEPNTVQPRKSVQEPNTVQPRKSVQEPNTRQIKADLSAVNDIPSISKTTQRCACISSKLYKVAIGVLAIVIIGVAVGVTLGIIRTKSNEIINTASTTATTVTTTTVTTSTSATTTSISTSTSSTATTTSSSTSTSSTTTTSTRTTTSSSTSTSSTTTSTRTTTSSSTSTSSTTTSTRTTTSSSTSTSSTTTSTRTTTSISTSTSSTTTSTRTTTSSSTSTTSVTTTTTGWTLLTSINEVGYGIWNTTAGGNSSPSVVGTGVGDYYPGEIPSNVFDGDNSTKYTNFGPCYSGAPNAVPCGLNTGLYFTPSRGSSCIQSIRFCTANSLDDRDPITITIEGSNQPSVALTLGSSWTLIYNGSTGLTTDPGRYTYGVSKNITNSAWYTSYRILVTSKRNNESCTHYAEVELGGY